MPLSRLHVPDIRDEVLADAPGEPDTVALRTEAFSAMNVRGWRARRRVSGAAV